MTHTEKVAKAVRDSNYTIRTPKASSTASKVITVDGKHYAWCSRHEVYEPVGNFPLFSDRKGGHKFHDCCNLADAHWWMLKNTITILKDTLRRAKLDDNKSLVSATADMLAHVKAVRAGRYNFNDNAEEYPAIPGYDYVTKIMIK